MSDAAGGIGDGKLTRGELVARSHGELKRAIATRIGTNPGRYGAGIGTERHHRLTADEVHGIAEKLGLGRQPHTSKQQLRNQIMHELGRAHRVGVRDWDTSDLREVLLALDDGGRDE